MNLSIDEMLYLVANLQVEHTFIQERFHLNDTFIQRRFHQNEQLSRSPLLSVHLPSTTSARSTSSATAAARASAQPTDEVRVLPRPGGQWEWPAARIVAMREPRLAIAGGAWGRNR